MQVASVAPVPERVVPSKPFADIENRRALLKLPQRGATSSLTTTKAGGNSGLLAEIYVTAPDQCDVTLENRELAFDKATAQLVALERSDKGSQRTWTVVRQPNGPLAKKVPLAKFTLDKQKLTFAWEAAPGVDPSVLEALRLCTLKLKVGEESVRCQMSEPEIMDAIHFKNSYAVIRDFPFRNLKVADSGSLSLRVQPHGFDGHLEPDTLPNLKPDEIARFFVFKDSPKAGPAIWVSAKFLWPGDGEEPKNGETRAIRSAAIIGYKEESLKAEECLEAQHRNLSLDEIDALIREKTSALKQLDINAKRAHNDFKAKQETGKNEIERLNMQIKNINGKLDDLKGQDRKEAERRKKELQEEKDRVEAAIDAARKNAEEKRQVHENTEAIVKRGKVIRDFAENVIANGRIEFQLVLARNGDSVILCQSQGYKSGKDF